MNNLIETRKKVYENFPKENLNLSSTDIVLFYDINNTNYTKLIEATQNFICKSLSLVHKKEFTWTDNFLENNDELIQKLPNKTPNGVLNPKKETVVEFMEIQKAVNKIFENLGVYKHIKKLAIPNIKVIQFF